MSAFFEERADWERGYWRTLLSTYSGNISQIARASGCHRHTIYRMLRRLGIITEPPVRGRTGDRKRRPLQEIV